MKGPGNHAIKKLYFLSNSFKKSVYICRNNLIYGDNRCYTNFARLYGLNVIKRRLHGANSSYYDRFISNFKNEIKKDQLLQDDIKLLKIKFYDFRSNVSNKSLLISSCISNTLFNISRLYGANKLVSSTLASTKKIFFAFSRILTNDFFLTYFKIIKDVFNDETGRYKIERELSNWKSDLNKEILSEETIKNDSNFRNCYTKYMKNTGTEYSVVLQNYSLWNRFSAKIRILPLLKNIFGKQYIKTVFSQNKISRAVKQMKALDPNFNLVNFISIFEAYVLPKFMDSYITFDEQKLRLHCGDIAFSLFCSNMRELKKMGLHLRTKILQLGDVELRGAENSEVIFSCKDSIIQNSQPILIFTFKTQQINYLQDSNGIIISGSMDDIRELHYSISVTPHPNTNIRGLEYPYLITELTIKGSAPIF